MAKQFQNIDEFKDWKSGYQIFRTPEGQAVLHDLLEYCHFLDDTFLPDAHERSAREGRRQVFLRIIQALNLSVEELLQVWKHRWVKPVVLPANDNDEV